MQLIEEVYFIYDDCDIEDILWDKEKYWQSQLFTNVKGMNSTSDLYYINRKGCIAENTDLVIFSSHYQPLPHFRCYASIKIYTYIYIMYMYIIGKKTY